MDKSEFWAKVRRKRFQGDTVKFLVIGSEYFLLKEIVLACQRLGIECRFLGLKNQEVSDKSFIEALLKETLLFTPDALLTVNHSGMDNQGILMGILEKLNLPLISWFLDNPHLILADYEGMTSPYLHIFTWDKDTIHTLKEQGFENTHYLPLGTSASRFSKHDHKDREQNNFLQGGEAKNTSKICVNPDWQCDVSFVGNSMFSRVEQYWKRANLPEHFLEDYLSFGANFALCDTRLIKNYIQEYKERYEQNYGHFDEGIVEQSSNDETRFMPVLSWYDTLENKAEKLAFEIGLVWEATRVYRLSCVREILPFSPLIVGDEDWKNALELQSLAQNHPFLWLEPLSYYTQLADFYPCSTVNFNCTAMQMKGASNQRVLDVPASGAFVLSDYREQVYELFEEKEVVMYKDIGEIPELIRFYLEHESEREKVALLAQKRVLTCHTWDIRVRELVETMRKTHG